MGFIHTHLHTELGSRLDGIATSMQYAEKAYSLGHPSMAVSDHGRMTAFFEHQKACDAYNIKPIFGVEAYISDELEVYNEKDKRQRTQNYHLVLLAKNEVGYLNLLRLNYISFKDKSHFYYTNRLSFEDLKKHSEGLIATTACMASPVGRRIINGDIDGAEKKFKLLKDIFGEDFYAEIHLNEFTKKLNAENPDQELVNNYLLEFSEKHNVKRTIAGDVHYLNKGDDELQKLSMAMRNKESLDNMSFEIESKNLFFHSEKDYFDFNQEFGYNYSSSDLLKWMNNTLEISEKCNYRMKERNRIYLPSISSNDEELVIKEAKKGLAEKLELDSFDDVPVEYKKRLKKEFDVISKKGFFSYLAILWDLFKYLEQEEVFRGPSRGSAGGSLLAYSLNITTIDPIKYNLLFERFLSEERTTTVVLNYFGD